MLIPAQYCLCLVILVILIISQPQNSNLLMVHVERGELNKRSHSVQDGANAFNFGPLMVEDKSCACNFVSRPLVSKFAYMH